MLAGKAHLYAYSDFNEEAHWRPNMLRASLEAMDIKYVVLDRDPAVTEEELDQQLSRYRTTAALCCRVWRLVVEQLIPSLKRKVRSVVDLLLDRGREDPRWDHRTLCVLFDRLSQESLMDPITQPQPATLSRILEEQTTSWSNPLNHSLAESVVGEGSNRLI